MVNPAFVAVKSPPFAGPKGCQNIGWGRRGRFATESCLSLEVAQWPKNWWVKTGGHCFFYFEWSPALNSFDQFDIIWPSVWHIIWNGYGICVLTFFLASTMTILSELLLAFHLASGIWLSGSLSGILSDILPGILPCIVFGNLFGSLPCVRVHLPLLKSRDLPLASGEWCEKIQAEKNSNNIAIYCVYIYMFTYVYVPYIYIYTCLIYIYLHYIILYYSLLYYLVFYFIILYYIILYYILYCIILYYIILYYIILYYTILYYIILYYIILYYIILYYIILYYIVLYCIILYYIIL